MSRSGFARTAAMALALAAMPAGDVVIGFRDVIGAARAQQVEAKAPKAAPTADGRPAGAVKLAIQISDADGNVFLQGERPFPAKTNAFDALREMVNVEYRTFVDLGVFVTGLGGVHPPDGSSWALYVDGKLSDKGISNINLTENKRIEWKIEKPTPH